MGEEVITRSAEETIRWGREFATRLNAPMLVLLTDDHPATHVLTIASEFFVVGSVDKGRELLAEAERLHPAWLDGIEATRQIRRSATSQGKARFRPPVCHTGQCLSNRRFIFTDRMPR